MIYTVTLNPSIDYVVFTQNFKVKHLNRAEATYKFAGGKGINVSRVLRTLDIPSTALGFAGGFPGDFIRKTLKDQNIKEQFIEVGEDTRINIKLKAEAETEINAPGPTVTEAQLEHLLQQMKETTKEDIVIIAGSVPRNLSHDVYQRIARVLSSTGANFVVDAEKGLMEPVLRYQPLFIKPNKEELEMIFGTQIKTQSQVIEYGRKLLERGAQSAIISLGGEGAIYIDERQILKAEVPTGTVVNTVGAGDSTVAGMVAGIVNGFSIEESFKQAVAAGTATAFSEDLANKDNITEISKQIRVKEL
ncbi:1-phosphofructokinase [Staphylococcus sp. SQ8-PEA]|uniref:Tagatose-6-phosphate kinase n=1 Tax=Staphylococcus marylandisciuri TaxID=2981529 RepID=A0ABT2QP78_9STAP|nr:1-phosphofructokinase [Staphylococcus marylandisciuri]MCU5745791.1 1-phosphofructokinase [Staphylococcus marylandisciuri]